METVLSDMLVGSCGYDGRDNSRVSRTSDGAKILST